MIGEVGHDGFFRTSSTSALLFIALNAEHAMWDKGLLPREDRGTDRIPTTMRRLAKRKRCLHVKDLKSTAAFAILNIRPDNGTGSGADPRPATEKLSGEANVSRRPPQGDGLQAASCSLAGRPLRTFGVLTAGAHSVPLGHPLPSLRARRSSSAPV